MALTFQETKRGYANLWDKARVTRQADAAKAASRIAASEARAAFEHVQKLTNVPWYMVGVILWRESDLNFKTYLGNGQSFSQVTTIVPKGRGPFASWYDGAADALTLQGIAGFDPANWTLERILFWLERYNGVGYFGKGINDPYLWSWTDLYSKGKYRHDGPDGYDPDFVDPQGGCVAALKALESQGVVTFIRETAVAAPVQPVPVPQPKVSPMPTTPAPIPSGFKFPDLATIEKFVESGDSVLPMVGMIWPPAAMLHTKIIPTLEAVLKIGAKYQTGGDLNAIMPDVAAQLHVLAETLAPGSTATAFAALRTPGAVTDRAVGAS